MYRTLCLLCKCTGLPQKQWMLTGAILIGMIRKVVLAQRGNTFIEEIIQTTSDQREHKSEQDPNFRKAGLSYLPSCPSNPSADHFPNNAV